MRRLFLSIAVACLALGCQAHDSRQAASRGDAALDKGDYETAITHFDEAIRIDPEFARAYRSRGDAYFELGRFDDAVANYSEQIRLKPQDDDARIERGSAYWRNGEHQEALADFEEAVKLNPKNDFAYAGLARVMSTSPQDELRDGKRALEFATKACELTEWKEPIHFWVLAAAYAEAGDFERAIDWHKKAMAAPDIPIDSMERAREMLKLYEEGKPFREVKK